MNDTSDDLSVKPSYADVETEGVYTRDERDVTDCAVAGLRRGSACAGPCL